MQNQSPKMGLVGPEALPASNEFNTLANNETVSNVEEKQCSSNSTVSSFDAITTAAEWLSVHRSECPEPIIPFVREKFGLPVMDAVHALQRGHALRYARAG